MPDLPLLLGSLLEWLFAFGLLGMVNAGIALWGKPLGRMRYALCVLLASCPALTPDNQAYTPPWGILSTVLTTFVIISAARLPDWDTFVCRPRPLIERYAWLTFPMLRGRSTAPNSDRLTRARGFLGRGLLKIVSWQVLDFVASSIALGELPWPVRSAFLMLFFVLNLTATCDFLSALCLVLGYEIDRLFDAPLLSTSPRDFWSRRWNRFISRFALKHVALRLRSRSDLVVIVAVFGVSGIFHEYFAWGVGGRHAGHGSMMLFFLIQGLVVWVGGRISLPKLPPLLSNALTFLWMTLTAPLFFYAVAPALATFEYPNAWLPFALP